MGMWMRMGMDIGIGMRIGMRMEIMMEMSMGMGVAMRMRIGSWIETWDADGDAARSGRDGMSGPHLRIRVQAPRVLQRRPQAHRRQTRRELLFWRESAAAAAAVGPAAASSPNRVQDVVRYGPSFCNCHLLTRTIDATAHAHPQSTPGGIGAAELGGGGGGMLHRRGIGPLFKTPVD